MDGSTIGVDTATTHITDGEIYALEHDGMLRVKFVYRLPGGGIRLRSFNREEYPDEEYSPEDMRSRQISMIGWVFGGPPYATGAARPWCGERLALARSTTSAIEQENNLSYISLNDV